MTEEKKQEQRQPCRATVKATAFVTKDQAKLKHEEPALMIEDEEYKHVFLISKGDAMALVDRLGKIMKKMV